ncbi:uncharacterized protein LOC144129936 [Amblyomma americanum]
MDDQGAVSYDGSLYKNQQLYYESDGSGREEDRPAAERRPGSVDDVPTVEVVPEVELRISDSDHDDDDRDEGKSEAAEGTASLPELFIREDERDPPATPAARSSLSSELRLALRDSFTLDLRSPGLARSRLNPYTIEVIANHASSPDEVLETVSTLEARLASRPLPPLVIDETEQDMGTWSSTSTAHSTSTVSRHELEEFLKSVEPPHDPPSWPQDAVTQTTPVVSRSSSFTWVTECGDELGSSKESLAARSADAAGTTLHTLAVATQSPSPVSDASSSSCDAPPTPLTPRASPSSQEVSSDLSDSAAHGTTTAATRARPLQNGASPSLPTLDGPECAQPSRCVAVALVPAAADAYCELPRNEQQLGPCVAASAGVFGAPSIRQLCRTSLRCFAKPRHEDIAFDVLVDMRVAAGAEGAVHRLLPDAHS